ncbi:MAG: S-layer homology domain-containing protein [Oscillospiraceae bacterium]|nr:S-layer homology domain-containing protein [Oscillospiraceae bacterium]
MKRVLSSVVAVALLAGGMQLSVFAADTENLKPGGDAGVEYDDAILNKYAEHVSGTKNQYDITLEVTGKNKAEEPPTDIVLVMDESNSMAGDRFQALQESAVTFVENTLHATENVRIGAVGYGNTASNVLSLTNDETDILNFMNAQTYLINEMTFTQDGLKMAESLFDSTDGHQHVIILLSDGVPSYSYVATSAADVTDDAVQDYGTGLFSGYKITGFDYGTTIGPSAIGSIASYFYTVDEAYQVGGKAITNHGDATIGQILDFKAASDKNTVYSVGILLADSAAAEGYYNGDFSTSMSLRGYEPEAYWTETNPDGIISPNETLTLYASCTNTGTAAIKAGMVLKLPSGLEDFFETNSADSRCTVTIDGTETGVYSYSDMLTRGAGTGADYKETVPVGAKYEIEVQLVTKDFHLEDYVGAMPSIVSSASFSFNVYVDGATTTMSPYNARANFTGPVFAFGSPFYTRSQAEYVLKNISSDGMEGSTYFDVSNLDDLIDVLSTQIYGAITDSIQNGTITDPMGPDFIQFETGTQDGADFKLAASDNALLDGVTATYSNGTVTVEGLNLSAGETVYITYRVTLQTDASGFVYGQAYPTNDTTTLLPVEGGQARAFPIPLVVGTKTSTGGSGGSITYKVTYHPNTTLGEADDVTSGISAGTTVTVKSGSIFTAPSGYTFLGWSEVEDGTATYKAGDTFTMPAKNADLYAVWTTSASGGGNQPTLDKENHFSYVIGYPEGDVRPENNITREEAATIFFRLLTNDSRISYWSQSNSFSDVAATRWSDNAISTMSEAGIVNGYADGSFRPSAYITRAEFASLAARFATENGTNTVTFSDVDGHWAQADIEKAARLEYITGYEDGTFRPDTYITRAEVMTLLNRVLERHIDDDDDLYSDMVTWSDNMDHTKWYYYDVQESTNSHYYELSADGSEQWTGIRVNPDWKMLEQVDSDPVLFSYA